MSLLVWQSDWPEQGSAWRPWRLFRNWALVAIRESWRTRSPRRVDPRPRLRRITDIGEPFYVLHENLGELVDSVLNESITRARKLGRAMRDFVDHGACCRRAAGSDHAGDCRRRGELSCQTLHKNCPNCRRLQTVSETTDGFSFQTGSTAHVMRVCRRAAVKFCSTRSR